MELMARDLAIRAGVSSERMPEPREGLLADAAAREFERVLFGRFRYSAMERPNGLAHVLEAFHLRFVKVDPFCELPCHYWKDMALTRQRINNSNAGSFGSRLSPNCTS